MSPSRKGIILAALQLAIVVSLAAKYTIDRARFPRVWARTAVYDPDLPIRGRYLSLMLAPDASAPYFDRTNRQPVDFFVPERKADFETPAFGPRAPEIWAEVTIPHKGPPRPIRLGIRKDGQIQPVPVN